MNQAIAIKKVTDIINLAITNEDYKHTGKTLKLLKAVLRELNYFLKEGIDYKIVLDSLDDSVYITDGNGVCIYVNPAHERNTTIKPEEVLGRSIYDITKEGTLFTGGSTIDVLKTKGKVLRLSTVTKTDPPEVGYSVGVPIFNQDGEIYQVVSTSRPMLSLRPLQQDFAKFINETKSIRDSMEKIRIINEDTDELVSKSLIGFSQSLKSQWETIKMAAPTDATVLITGESGVGKEVVADEIYRLSNRKSKPFIKVNCASIPDNLLESELFGYEKGAFSGANSHGKQGLFELANGGTLFLDEIGDMPMDFQAKLLRAIQHKEIIRVGGTKTIKLDIRFISATNSNLKEKIRDGEFRQDLFFRLNVIPIEVPPLRDRLSDLEDLIRHFENAYSEKYNKSFTLTENQIEIMKRYSWPGNIRELENIIEYLTICASSSRRVTDELILGLLEISPKDMDRNIEDKTIPTSKSAASSPSEYPKDLHPAYNTVTTSAFTDINENVSSIALEPNATLAEAMENYEKQLIESVLMSSSNLREAGKKLGVNASTISRKIKAYGINYEGSK